MINCIQYSEPKHEPKHGLFWVLFLCQNHNKGGDTMLNTEMTERFYSHPIVQKMSIGQIDDTLHVLEDLMSEEREVNYEPVSELFPNEYSYDE